MSASLNRRNFLKRAGTLAALAAPGSAQSKSVALVVDPNDAVGNAPSARWAADTLRAALTAHGVKVNPVERLNQAAGADLTIVAAGASTAPAQSILKGVNVTVPATTEALALAETRNNGRPVILAAGHDTRGLLYALLELADRAQLAPEPFAALSIAKPIVEKPANRVRSIARLFCTDVEDLAWFNDRDMWPQYFSMLAAQRYNRFQLSLGIGYDFLREVTDAYFLYAYPFLLSVPGYNVRVKELPDAERDRNLAQLKFIAQQAVNHGIDFQLGIWTHGYEWINSPHPNYTITGLTPETQPTYSRDALTILLKQIPEISGITFRIHGESGVAEGNYPFWKTVFDGVVNSGRKVEIDMHAKGMDQGMVDTALGTGMPIKISPKYWAEHLGMPYHQAAIRELELPKQGRGGTGLMALSAGSRSFLRYGYGDLLAEDRKYGILHRIWPGTQRLLLWGDPVTAAAHSRAFSFCGTDGVEIMEPLSFKGRRGSGLKGDRDGYADKSLQQRWDWQKYEYSFRVWGRAAYNPDTEPAVWQRALRNSFDAAAPAAETALASASRILPIITTTHGASAGNNTYWPEVYTNQPIVDAGRRHPYTDSPAPRVFGNVSPLDPQMFSRINDFAAELLQGAPGAKYSPVEVAVWLEDLADTASKQLAQAKSQVHKASDPEFRRLAIDVELEASIGRFFSTKFRSGVLYNIHERTGDRAALEESLKAYERARAIFAQLAEVGKVYVPDITVGELPHLRGHWLDRLPAMDGDIADMRKRLEAAKPAAGPQPENVRTAIAAALGRPQRTTVPVRHTPPARFQPGQAVEIALALDKGAKVSAVHLHYRRVNQAESYESIEMQPREGRYAAAIPAKYTESPFPLQYYFELQQAPGKACLHPGFASNLANQPYFVIRRA